MLISPAFAQTAGAAAQPGLFQSMMPLVLIFAVFYFLLIRPQQKKQKMHKEMLGTIRRGDRIVTGGGILGTVVKVMSDSELKVEIADGVKVRVDRGLVSSVIAKPEAADKAAAQDNDEDDVDEPEEAAAVTDETKTATDEASDSEQNVTEKDNLVKLLKD